MPSHSDIHFTLMTIKECRKALQEFRKTLRGTVGFIGDLAEEGENTDLEAFAVDLDEQEDALNQLDKTLRGAMQVVLGLDHRPEE